MGFGCPSSGFGFEPQGPEVVGVFLATCCALVRDVVVKADEGHRDSIDLVEEINAKRLPPQHEHGWLLQQVPGAFQGFTEAELAQDVVGMQSTTWEYGNRKNPFQPGWSSMGSPDEFGWARTRGWATPGRGSWGWRSPAPAASRARAQCFEVYVNDCSEVPGRGGADRPLHSRGSADRPRASLTGPRVIEADGFRSPRAAGRARRPDRRLPQLPPRGFAGHGVLRSPRRSQLPHLHPTAAVQGRVGVLSRERGHSVARHLDRADLQLQGEPHFDPGEEVPRARLYEGPVVGPAVGRDRVEVAGPQGHDRGDVLHAETVGDARVPLLDAPTHGLALVLGLDLGGSGLGEGGDDGDQEQGVGEPAHGPCYLVGVRRSSGMGEGNR